MSHSPPSLPSTYKTITLKSNVQGEPTVDHFGVREDPLDAESLQDGYIIVHTVYLSVDPYILGKIGADKNRTFGNPLKPGDAIIGRIVGEVVRSKSSKFKVGDAALIDYQWTEYAVVKDDVPEKIEPATIQDVPLSYYMGVVGMPGQTAYWGLLDVGQPREGDTVVVSAAAGAVGSLVTQIAKIKGAKHIVGIAGGPEKCKDLTEKFGCTHAIDYKNEDVAKKLDEFFPNQKDGFIDVYFDNVGYDQLEAMIPRMKMGGRIATCGQIGGYTKQEDKEPTRWKYLIHYFLWRCLKMQGFLAGTYRPRYAESSKQLSEWVRSGQLKYEEDVYETKAIAAAPEAFLRLFKGQNRGKQVVHVADSLFGYK